MSGENTYAQELINEALKKAENDPALDPDALGRALLNATIDALKQDRSAADLASELHYLADNLDEDEFVITRGC